MFQSAIGKRDAVIEFGFGCYLVEAIQPAAVLMTNVHHLVLTREVFVDVTKAVGRRLSGQAAGA